VKDAKREDPFALSAPLRIWGREGLYKVLGAVAIDGGGYRVSLEDRDGDEVVEELYCYAGTWRTEQLEEVTAAFAPANPAAAAVAAIPSVTPATSKCRSCDAPIYWERGSRGGMVPMDPGGGSHFLTCPHASQWSGKKRAAPEAPPAPAAVVAPERETYDEPDRDGQLALFEM
jgi:hypothetical protein